MKVNHYLLNSYELFKIIWRPKESITLKHRLSKGISFSKEVTERTRQTNNHKRYTSISFCLSNFFILWQSKKSWQIPRRVKDKGNEDCVAIPQGILPIFITKGLSVSEVASWCIFLGQIFVQVLQILHKLLTSEVSCIKKFESSTATA